MSMLKENFVKTENLDYKYHPEITDDYVIPDVMIVCDDCM